MVVKKIRGGGGGGKGTVTAAAAMGGRCAHATGAERGEVGTARWGPNIVLGGGVKRFKPFSNSNG
jgi:hypothetical protein